MTQGGKTAEVQSIQLLRAGAALLVALVHLALGYANHVGPGLGIAAITPLANQLAQVAVALFFLVSGHVMVISSAGMFGRPHGTRMFLTRRAVRILPPYWLATLLLLAMYAVLERLPPLRDSLLSLAMVPHWSDRGAVPVPVLWQGWTLFYELVFYLLFGLGISLGRRAALLIACLGIGALGLTGMVLQPQAALAYAVTRPVLLIFLGGIAMALWRERGHALPGWLRLLSLAAFVPALLLAPHPPASALHGAGYLLWAGLPALLLFVAAVGGDWRVPGYRLVSPLGHASYALYLLHVPLGHVWNLFYPSPRSAGEPWSYYAGLVAFTLVASLAFWRWVEKPLTRWLNARLLPRPAPAPIPATDGA